MNKPSKLAGAAVAVALAKQDLAAAKAKQLGETDLERCVRQVREKLAEKPNPNNPGGFVICTLTWHGAIDLVSEVLTSAELKRVRFRVNA